MTNRDVPAAARAASEAMREAERSALAFAKWFDSVGPSRRPGITITEAFAAGYDAALATCPRADDVIRDLAHAIGPHTQGCYRCKEVMKRHSDRVSAALRAAAAPGAPPATGGER